MSSVVLCGRPSTLVSHGGAGRARGSSIMSKDHGKYPEAEPKHALNITIHICIVFYMQWETDIMSNTELYYESDMWFRHATFYAQAAGFFCGIMSYPAFYYE